MAPYAICLETSRWSSVAVGNSGWRCTFKIAVSHGLTMKCLSQAHALKPRSQLAVLIWEVLETLRGGA
jgi:hypothetical protein